RPIDELQLHLQRRQRHANTVHRPRHRLLRTQESERRGPHREVRRPLRLTAPATKSVEIEVWRGHSCPRWFVWGGHSCPPGFCEGTVGPRLSHPSVDGG